MGAQPTRPQPVLRGPLPPPASQQGAPGGLAFNAPPNWPAPPLGWTPPPGWKPNPAWGPPPEGWQLWQAYPDAPAATWSAPAVPAPALPWYRQAPKWLCAAIGTVIIGIIIADMVPGVAGHVIAFVVWATAGVICLRPATSKAKSKPRTRARISLAVSACFVVYAGALAVASSGSGAGLGSVAGDNGKVAPHCYATVSDAFGDTVTLGVDASDCTTVAADVQGSMPPGFTATPNTAKGPGTAVCWGMVASDVVSVIDPEGNPSNAVCSDLGFSALP